MSFTDVNTEDVSAPISTTNNPTDFNKTTAGTYKPFAPYQNVTGSATQNQPTNFNASTAGTFNPFVPAEFAGAAKVTAAVIAKAQPPSVSSDGDNIENQDPFAFFPGPG